MSSPRCPRSSGKAGPRRERPPAVRGAGRRRRRDPHAGAAREAQRARPRDDRRSRGGPRRSGGGRGRRLDPARRRGPGLLRRCGPRPHRAHARHVASRARAGRPRYGPAVPPHAAASQGDRGGGSGKRARRWRRAGHGVRYRAGRRRRELRLSRDPHRLRSRHGHDDAHPGGRREAGVRARGLGPPHRRARSDGDRPRAHSVLAPYVRGRLARVHSRPGHPLADFHGAHEALAIRARRADVRGGIDRGASVNAEARSTEDMRAGVRAFLARRTAPISPEAQ